MGIKKNMDPDTSGLIPWQKGQSGNPKGNSPEAWVVRRRNAEKIVQAQAILSEALLKKATELAGEGNDPQMVIDALIRADITNFSREVMDRGFGKAQGSLDLTSSDGSAGPTTIRLVSAKDYDESDG